MHHIFNKLRSSEDLKLVSLRISLKLHFSECFNFLSISVSIKVVKLEALGNLTPDYDRYFCLVSCTGRQGTEESVILGCDLTSTTTSIGLVIPVMLDMEVNLHGEGWVKKNSIKCVFSCKFPNNVKGTSVPFYVTTDEFYDVLLICRSCRQ